jgi:hypothetical protein
VSKMLVNTSLGRDVMEMYKEGIINQHSFGFEIAHSVQMANYELVKEAKVHEVSTVTFAANPAATTISVNSFMDLIDKTDKSQQQLEMIGRMVNNLDIKELNKNHEYFTSSEQLQLQILNKLESIANLLKDGSRSEPEGEEGGMDDLFRFISNY